MASREKDKPAAGMLRRGLAARAGAPGSDADACPDPEILAAYSENALDADEVARYELHFSQCAHCREQLAVMSRASEPAATAPASRHKWVWPWTWFVLAPVTTALLIAAVVMVRRPAAIHPAEPAAQPLVAMNQPTAPPAAPNADAVAKVAHARAAAPSAPNASLALRSPALSAPNVSSDKSDFAQSARALQPSRDDRKEFAANAAPDAAEFSRLKVLKNAEAAPSATPPPAPPPATSAGQVSQEANDKLTGGVSDNSAKIGQVAGAPSQATQNQLQLSQGTIASRASAQTDSVMAKPAPGRSEQMLVRSPDPQALWRILGGRLVERSNDGGTTWQARSTIASAGVSAGAAPSADTCWLVGRGGIVLLTTDGRNWKTIVPPEQADFIAVAATDALSATVTASDGRRFTTRDGGKSWTAAP